MVYNNKLLSINEMLEKNIENSLLLSTILKMCMHNAYRSKTWHIQNPELSKGEP